MNYQDQYERHLAMIEQRLAATYQDRSMVLPKPLMLDIVRYQIIAFGPGNHGLIATFIREAIEELQDIQGAFQEVNEEVILTEKTEALAQADQELEEITQRHNQFMEKFSQYAQSMGLQEITLPESKEE